MGRNHPRLKLESCEDQNSQIKCFHTLSQSSKMLIQPLKQWKLELRKTVEASYYPNKPKQKMWLAKIISNTSIQVWWNDQGGKDSCNHNESYN